MKTYGIPNDTIIAMNPIFCVLLGPVIQNGLYPLLNKKNLEIPVNHAHGNGVRYDEFINGIRRHRSKGHL